MKGLERVVQAGLEFQHQDQGSEVQGHAVPFTNKEWGAASALVYLSVCSQSPSKAPWGAVFLIHSCSLSQ